jgi:hypothetical protein
MSAEPAVRVAGEVNLAAVVEDQGDGAPALGPDPERRARGAELDPVGTAAWQG